MIMGAAFLAFMIYVAPDVSWAMLRSMLAQ